MFDKLKSVEIRYDDLNELLSDAKIIAQQSEYQKYAKEQSDLTPIVKRFKDLKKIVQQLEDSKKILEEEKDPEILEMAEEDLAQVTIEKQKAESDLKLLLLPKDPRDERNVIVEIRAGTGGEEAALFSTDLFRMYSRYAEEKKWQVEILSSNLTGKGGFKEVIFNITGKGVYSKLKYEGGTHRVQRVPDTESQGRIHTSAVTVAILPEVEDVDIKINPSDIKIDVYRASGPGGQSVNTTDSAVRLTFVPTGMIVTCQDEKSQHKNREKAMKVLRARLYDEEQKKAHDEQDSERKQQVGSGDRSERIRTYNYPQERVTDHRIGLTLHKLSAIMEGAMEEVIDALTLHFQSEALKGND
ncbi:peptide chain release factor 1 [Nitrospinaceae bacterium]|nr:peptide chain release factor 1 [Nitrospinaceae bacterium]